MRHQQATSIVAMPLTLVEAGLADVTSWSAFLHDVESVQRVGPRDYVFELTDGHRRQRHVRVVHDRARHRFFWTTRRVQGHGGLRSGSVQLRALDSRRTAVELCLLEHPDGLLGGFADLFSGGDARARVDLQRLERHLAHQVSVPA